MEMLSLHMMIIVVIFLVNCHFGFFICERLESRQYTIRYDFNCPASSFSIMEITLVSVYSISDLDVTIFCIYTLSKLFIAS